MQYTDFTLRARDWQDGQFKVEVTGSPIDRTREPETVRADLDALAAPLAALERKTISRAGLIGLGQALGALLLPGQVGMMFWRSLDALGPAAGLRLRLVLDDPRIADLPWEYAYASLAGGEPGLDGFLALNPRCSFVRHEALPFAAGDVAARPPLKVVVALAAPANAPPLDLPAERRRLEEALRGIAGLQVEFIEHLTAETLAAAVQGAHIFHFAGHAIFSQAAPPAGAPGARTLSAEDALDAAQPPAPVAGQGALALENSAGQLQLYPADRLAVTLRAAGVRLAYFGACETGRRDGVNIWSGVAPALMKVGIPGAVAMQYTVEDRAAIAFAGRLYERLAAGLELDEAVTAGRLAMLNAATTDTVEWGVPVLYLRAASGVVFPAVAADNRLEAQRRALHVAVEQRVHDLYGVVTGARAKAIYAGEVSVRQQVGTVRSGGSLTGVQGGAAGGESQISADQQIDQVEDGGSVTGVDLDSLG